MADRGPSELGKWSGTPSRLAADGQSGHPRPWPDCLLRWIPLIGVTAAVCAPAFVTAQVPAEPVEIEERLEVPAPARALGAVKAKSKATANAKASVKTDAKAKAEMDLMKAVTTIRKKRAAPAAPVVVDRQPVLRLNGGMVDARTQQFRQILRIEYLFVKAILIQAKMIESLSPGPGSKAAGRRRSGVRRLAETAQSADRAGGRITHGTRRAQVHPGWAGCRDQGPALTSGGGAISR